MNNVKPAFSIALRIWLLTAGVAGMVWLVSALLSDDAPMFWVAIPFTIGAAVCSCPVFCLLLVLFNHLNKSGEEKISKLRKLVVFCLCVSMCYGIAAFGIQWLLTAAMAPELIPIITSGLFACSLLSLFLLRHPILYFFSISEIKTTHTMETSNTVSHQTANPGSSWPNKVFIKGLVTGGLILLMLIPTIFIGNLVSERKARQKEISREVGGKWAGAQTLSGPFLYLPYKTYEPDKDGKLQTIENSLWILPENLTVQGKIDPQVRKRSIYKVLLYRAFLQNQGNFEFILPKDVDMANVQFADAKVCFRLSDFKGIEQKLTVRFNGAAYDLSPGLPDSMTDDIGLSAPIPLSAESLGKKIAFSMDIHLKGSEQLYFLPLSGNSEFSLQSAFRDPSFDGNSLPAERSVSDSGFSARWTFNKANLPFNTVLREYKLKDEALAFGLTMLEPADQYAKTSRSVKYAMLIIGLTFGLFFIAELMQHKPVHPVQYILIGLALVIFYTLLLSISEFVLFDLAYVIASLATISLITIYAYNHFKKFSSAGIFAGLLTVLYGFIFVLIRLEDTALLVGSIGLFIILALVMFASRKINWYGEPLKPAVSF